MVSAVAANAAPLCRRHHAACWLVLIGYLLDLADGAVARQLNACSALGKWRLVGEPQVKPPREVEPWRGVLRRALRCLTIAARPHLAGLCVHTGVVAPLIPQDRAPIVGFIPALRPVCISGIARIVDPVAGIHLRAPRACGPGGHVGLTHCGSLASQAPSWTTLLTSPPSASPPRCSSGRLTSSTTSCACVTSCRCWSASASSPAVGCGLLHPSASTWSLPVPCLLLRDPLRVPRPALHLLLRHPVQRLLAVRGQQGPAARAGHGHDHLHDTSDLLPPRPSPGIPGLEESGVRWR